MPLHMEGATGNFLKIHGGSSWRGNLKPKNIKYWAL